MLRQLTILFQNIDFFYFIHYKNIKEKYAVHIYCSNWTEKPWKIFYPPLGFKIQMK